MLNGLLAPTYLMRSQSIWLPLQMTVLFVSSLSSGQLEVTSTKGSLGVGSSDLSCSASGAGRPLGSTAGSYRVVCEVDEDAKVVSVLRVDHRAKKVQVRR